MFKFHLGGVNFINSFDLQKQVSSKYDPERERTLWACGSFFLYHVHKAQFPLWPFRLEGIAGRENNLSDKKGKILNNVDRFVRSILLLPPLPDFVSAFYCAKPEKKKSTNLISWSETWPLRSLSAFLPLYNPGNMCVHFKEHLCGQSQ